VNKRRFRVSSRFRSSPLCPPFSKGLNVSTIIHTVPTASTYNTRVRFPNRIVQRVFFSRARRRYIFFPNNNTYKLPPTLVLSVSARAAPSDTDQRGFSRLRMFAEASRSTACTPVVAPSMANLTFLRGVNA
jgi:hypothetical protein